jgi:divalent metal cation (Fe/Co/Zn/Cd) transporter
VRKKIHYGLQAITALIIVYAAEMVILSAIYRFLSTVPYRFVAPPIVVVVMLVGWATVFVDMEKRGEWWR